MEKLRESLEASAIDALLVTGRENCRYYSGFTGSNGWLLITAKKQFLITDSRYFTQGEKESPWFEQARCNPGEGKSLFAPLLRTAGSLGIHHLGIEEDILPIQSCRKITSDPCNIEIADASEIITSPRLIKDSFELEKIRKAVTLAQEAFEKILPKVTEGKTESSIGALLEYNMKIAGAEKALDSIVASGNNSSLPHAGVSDRRIQKGDMITIDWGARFEGYHSDMTRTLRVG